MVSCSFAVLVAYLISYPLCCTIVEPVIQHLLLLLPFVVYLLGHVWLIAGSDLKCRCEAVADAALALGCS